MTSQNPGQGTGASILCGLTGLSGLTALASLVTAAILAGWLSSAMRIPRLP